MAPQDALTEGMLQALPRISAEDVRDLADYAATRFEAGDALCARNIYFILLRLEAAQAEWWLGFGLCCQRLGEHEDALHAFARAGLQLPEDPRPACYAGISFRLLGMDEAAHRAGRAARLASAARSGCEAIRMACDWFAPQGQAS